MSVYRRAGKEIDNTYGPGEGAIFMDNLVCNGPENSLADCSHNGWNVHDCYNTEAVAIECHGRSTIGKCTAQYHSQCVTMQAYIKVVDIDYCQKTSQFKTM